MPLLTVEELFAATAPASANTPAPEDVTKTRCLVRCGRCDRLQDGVVTATAVWATIVCLFCGYMSRGKVVR